MTSTESVSDASVGGGVDGMIKNDRNNARWSASESKTAQPSVSRRRRRTAGTWLLLNIDRTGRSGVSTDDAPLFEIDVMSGPADSMTIRHGGVFQSAQRGKGPQRNDSIAAAIH
jgi:hypothetical protein